MSYRDQKFALLHKILKCKVHLNDVRTFFCPNYCTAVVTSYVHTVTLSGEVNKSKDVNNNKKSDGPITRPVFLYTCNLSDWVDDAVTAWY